MNSVKGFTLLELMVSMVILSILLSFAVLSIGDSGQAQLKQEARQLNALLTLASQEAVIQGKDMGVAFTQDHYYFYNWQAGQWELFVQDAVFYPRTLSPDIQLILAIEGEAMTLVQGTCVENACKPQLLLLSSGELVPFELTLTMPNQSLDYRLQGMPTHIVLSTQEIP